MNQSLTVPELGGVDETCESFCNALLGSLTGAPDLEVSWRSKLILERVEWHGKFCSERRRDWRLLILVFKRSQESHALRSH